MPLVRIPALHHLCRNAYDDAERVRRELVKVVLDGPIISYELLTEAVRDLFVLRQPYSEVAAGIARGIRNERHRDNCLEILPLLQQHFQQIAPNFINEVQPRFYSVRRGILVPFAPPMIYGAGGRRVIPWFIFWRRNALVDQKLALFVSIARELMADDPDLEDAELEILDFGLPKGAEERTLKVIDASTIAAVSQDKKTRVLDAFAEGYYLAEAELRGMGVRQRASREDDSPAPDSRQGDLFS